MRLLEHDDRVRERMMERFLEQPEPSVREIKRILTTWQYYVRVLILLGGFDNAPLFKDARTLIVLAEIVTRWSAAERRLHRRVDGEHGLRILAKVVDDDWEWPYALRRLGLHASAHINCTRGPRDLLRRYDGDQLAASAAELV